ncbi:MAG: ATP-binding protein [Planctomycetia bacterium]|nr:ATP-binding protein [Planctomycetia bacterium]
MIGLISKNWTIRWRLTIWNAVVLAVIGVAFSAMMLAMVHRHLIARADSALVDEIRELIEEINFYPDTVDLGQQLAKRYYVHFDYHFQVLAEDGRPLFRSRFLTYIQLPVPATPGELRGQVLQDLALPNLGPHRLLTMAMRDSKSRPMLLQVLRSRVALDQEFQSYIWMVLTLGPLAVVAAVGAGYVLARKALAPIEKIAATAERISAETLSERVDVPNPYDELGRLSATLNRTFDRLQRSLDEMRQFTADAAHELRSPLAVMRTEAEVALRSARSVEEYRHVIEINLEETTRLAAVVDQLLTLSRHDAGTEIDLHDEVPLDALLADVADKFRTVAQEKWLTFEVAPLPSWNVEGDDIRLSQLFFNLLDNAIKYTPRGGHVAIKAEANGKLARFIIEDTGIGIPAEHLPHLFKRFYRVDHSRNRAFGGTGLGLAICKSIVESHHGQIEVNSQPNLGTRFTVTFPGKP